MKSLTLVVAALALGVAVSGPALAGKKRTGKITDEGTSNSTLIFQSSGSTRSGESSGGQTTTTTTSGAYTSGAATLSHPGRLLASNCFQCHGTNGHGMENLAGAPASEIVSELYEMKLKPAGAEMMNVHAQGYTTAQINLIADYFSKQQQ